MDILADRDYFSLRGAAHTCGRTATFRTDDTRRATLLQGVIGVLQVLIGLTMVRGYRRSGLGMVKWPEPHNPTNAFRIVLGDAADDFEIRPSPDRLPGLLFVPVPEEKADKDS
jgi:hypothetical protein